MHLRSPFHASTALCALGLALLMSLAGTAVARAEPQAQPSEAAARPSLARVASHDRAAARPLAHMSLRIPTGVLKWFGRKAARSIGRQTRRLIIDYGQRRAIDYYCGRWYDYMGSYRTWYYWALRDYRVARAWQFCSIYW